jgi:methionyl-tRNA formyltransferase
MNKNPIRFGFFGTPHFSVLILDELKRGGFTPSFVVTNPDRPQGRSLKIKEPEVKVWAKQEGIKVFQPETITHAFLEEMRNEQVDVFIVAAYGKILPKELIYLPPRRSLNVHPSLLPKYRGATPIESVLLADDRNTGVTIICIDEKMDHGPIVAMESIHLNDWPISAPFLEKELAHAGGKLLCKILPDWMTERRRTREKSQKKMERSIHKATVEQIT